MASYNYNWPAVTINSGPVQFLYNGSTTTVAEDTSVPGNSKPLPVINLDPTGTPTDFNYGAVGAHTPRTAAQIGNATGAADFNAGATGAQTLRAVANQGAANTIANAWKVAGTDGTNSQAYLATGEAKVSVTQALPTGANVIGAVTQSGTWNTNDAANGPVTPGTVATKSELTGLQFNTVLPTATTGQQVAAQCDSSGRALIGSIASALPAGTNTIGKVDQGAANATPWNENIAQIAGAVPSATNAMPSRLTNGTAFLDYGNGAISANTLRVSAQIANATGAVDFNTGNASAQTPRVVLASNQPSIPVISGANINGSNTDSTVSTVATLTPPANAIGFILMNLDTSSANIRWRIGATATASSGQQLQLGRDTGFIPCAANISICAETGTQNYNIQWILTV